MVHCDCINCFGSVSVVSSSLKDSKRIGGFFFVNDPILSNIESSLSTKSGGVHELLIMFLTDFTPLCCAVVDVLVRQLTATEGTLRQCIPLDCGMT